MPADPSSKELMQPGLNDRKLIKKAVSKVLLSS
jgi:hypothetical protein